MLQHDVFFPDLTLKQTLVVSHRSFYYLYFKLVFTTVPPDIHDGEKTVDVDNVIHQLALTKRTHLFTVHGPVALAGNDVVQ